MFFIKKYWKKNFSNFWHFFNFLEPLFWPKEDGKIPTLIYSFKGVQNKHFHWLILIFANSQKILCMSKKAKIGTFLDDFWPITKSTMVQIAKFFQNSNSPYSIYPEKRFLIKNSKNKISTFLVIFLAPTIQK